MPLTKEQIAELKSQLYSQIKDLPEEKKLEAEKQINSLSDKAIEDMLNQQLDKDSNSDKESIFRKIVSKEVPSVVVDENSHGIAVLDINPISKGHTLIIPKVIIASPNSMPKECFSLGEKISKKLTENLKATSVRMETDVLFGETIIHVLPVYEKPLTKESQRNKATIEELEELKKSINIIKPQNIPNKIVLEEKKPEKSAVLKLKRRIA